MALYLAEVSLAQLMQCLGTVENHGNTEITETVIFVKGRDFAIMP